jgi:hypothetical protein
VSALWRLPTATLKKLSKVSVNGGNLKLVAQRERRATINKSKIHIVIVDAKWQLCSGT